MYCLDTNVIIEIIRGDEELTKKIQNLLDKGINFFITAVSLCELYKGAYGHAKPDEKIRVLEDFISNFELLSLNKESSQEFGKSYKLLEKAGSITKEFDLMIASIVKVNNLILVTRDKKHFEGLGIKVEVW